MSPRDVMLVLAAAASLGLAGSHRGADTGATRSATEPGSPGTGNGVQVARPQAPDSSTGRGPSGVKGSLPHPGSSGGDAPAGVSGSGGTNTMGGPATGRAGGMNNAPGQPTGVAAGGTNRTSGTSTGNR